MYWKKPKSCFFPGFLSPPCCVQASSGRRLMGGGGSRFNTAFLLRTALPWNWSYFTATPSEFHKSESGKSLTDRRNVYILTSNNLHICLTVVMFKQHCPLLLFSPFNSWHQPGFLKTGPDRKADIDRKKPGVIF